MGHPSLATILSNASCLLYISLSWTFRTWLPEVLRKQKLFEILLG